MESEPPRAPHRSVKVLALIAVALSVMCAVLALAWRREHEAAACWRAQAQYGLETDLGCGG